jgi:hypothetical protein
LLKPLPRRELHRRLCAVKLIVPFLLLIGFGASEALAQREGRLPEWAPVRTAREVPTHSADMPGWTNPPGFEKDVFTFARIRYTRNPYAPRSAGYCFVDFPDADLNLSYRLQQLTTISVDPDGRVLDLTDPELVRYPWIYMVEPGALRLDEAEVVALRNYLELGGFLMADDFWGPRQWASFEREMKRVFPERGFVELPMDHPVFHCVFDLRGSKNDLQVPNFWTGERSQYTGVSWEVHDGVHCRDVSIRGLLDDRGRMMVIACHNTDNGDGWEREQEYAYFFREFSEKRAYPLGINIIFYAMTH